MTRRPCVRWGPSSLLKSDTARTPLFGPCLLWQNGWMDQDASCYEGRPRPRLHCVTWGSSIPHKGHSPQLWPMCIVAKRSPISATVEHLFIKARAMAQASLSPISLQSGSNLHDMYSYQKTCKLVLGSTKVLLQAWCCLQVKLCDPCLSALCVPWCKNALYKYSSFPFLSFPFTAIIHYHF